MHLVSFVVSLCSFMFISLVWDMKRRQNYTFLFVMTGDENMDKIGRSSDDCRLESIELMRQRWWKGQSTGVSYNAPMDCSAILCRLKELNYVLLSFLYVRGGCSGTEYRAGHNSRYNVYFVVPAVRVTTRSISKVVQSAAVINIQVRTPGTDLRLAVVPEAC